MHNLQLYNTKSFRDQMSKARKRKKKLMNTQVKEQVILRIDARTVIYVDKGTDLDKAKKDYIALTDKPIKRPQ